MLNHLVVKVYYVEDDEDDQVLFRDALSEINIPIDLACFSGGEEFERVLKKRDCEGELLFLDLNLRGKSGLQILDSIQSEIKQNNLKVVIFSTSAALQNVQETYKRNAVLFVQKPVDFNLLVDILRGIIINRKTLQLPVLFQNFLYSS